MKCPCSSGHEAAHRGICVMLKGRVYYGVEFNFDCRGLPQNLFNSDIRSSIFRNSMSRLFWPTPNSSTDLFRQMVQESVSLIRQGHMGDLTRSAYLIL
jgi:hypothetical protein